MTRFTKIGTPFHGRRTARGNRYDSIYPNRDPARTDAAALVAVGDTAFANTGTPAVVNTAVKVLRDRNKK